MGPALKWNHERLFLWKKHLPRTEHAAQLLNLANSNSHFNSARDTMEKSCRIRSFSQFSVRERPSIRDLGLRLRGNSTQFARRSWTSWSVLLGERESVVHEPSTTVRIPQYCNARTDLCSEPPRKSYEDSKLRKVGKVCDTPPQETHMMPVLLHHAYKSKTALDRHGPAKRSCGINWDTPAVSYIIEVLSPEWTGPGRGFSVNSDVSFHQKVAQCCLLCAPEWLGAFLNS